MRTCAVPGCKGKLSVSGSKVHKLPDQEPLRSQWITAVPALLECSAKLKSPSICCLHFSPADYGKNKKYLKPTAVPSLHLQLGENTTMSQSLLQVCKKGSCPKKDCQDIFAAAKSIASQNLCLSNQIKALERKVQHLEHELKKSSSLDFIGDDDFMLGPTQIKCLANKTTKGRNWTPEEKSKAKTLKAMTSSRCYNYIRKNVVPLPCPTELREKNVVKCEEAKVEEKAQLTTETFVINALPHGSHVKSEELEGTEQIVHHVVIPPEVWATQDGDQKFEFIVTQE